MANPTLPSPPAENEDPWYPTRSAFDAAVKLAVESQLAAIDSPVFTGTPAAPTPATADNDTSLATTAFVKAQGYAPLANPAFTGNPTAPTPTAADNDTSIATTAFVKAQGYAPLASPALTGSPTAPTPTAGDNDTSIATTAFVTTAAAARIPAAIVDAKGDIIAATAADTVARVAVGTDGQVLTADSASAAGVKWAAAGGGALAPVSATLYWQMLPYTGYAAAVTTGGAEFAIQMPLRAQTFAAVSSWVETAAAGGAIIIGFRKIGADGVPGTVEVQVALPAEVTGRTTVTGLSLALSGGLYAICYASVGGAGYRPAGHPNQGATQFGGYGGGLHTVGAMETIKTRSMVNGNAVSGSTLATSWSLMSSIVDALPPIVAVRRSA